MTEAERFDLDARVTCITKTETTSEDKDGNAQEKEVHTLKAKSEEGEQVSFSRNEPWGNLAVGDKILVVIRNDQSRLTQFGSDGVKAEKKK